MKRPTDTDLLRKAVQEKLQGASETPPEGAFERIQTALSNQNKGVTPGRSLGVGLSVVVILATSLLLFQARRDGTDLTTEKESRQSNSSLVKKESVDTQKKQPKQAMGSSLEK